MSTNRIVRGLRNNNPLNIVRNPHFCWLGEVKENDDKTFVKFETMAQGMSCRIETAARLLRKAQMQHHQPHHPTMGARNGK